MSLPPEYTTAKTNLLAFRTKILNDLVGARIVAGLDASHDSMQKYKGKIDSLGIVPYMFGRVREYAMALRFKNMDVDVGGIRRIGASWVGSTSDYPLNEPYNVPQRKLPPVDVFEYTAIADVDLLNKMNEANLKSYILLQCSHDTFNEVPDVEDASYEYYLFTPVQKYRGEWKFVNPMWWIAEYHHMKGERTLMWLELTEKLSGDVITYLVDVWLDMAFFNDAGDEQSIPVMWETSTTKEISNVILVVAGHRTSHAYLGVWTVGSAKLRQMTTILMATPTEIRVADSRELDTAGEELVWQNTFDVSVTVNSLAMGNTSPVSGTKEKRVFGTSWNITANPNSGYMVDHWERNGMNVGGGLTYSHTVRKDELVYCVFKAT